MLSNNILIIHEQELIQVEPSRVSEWGVPTGKALNLQMPTDKDLILQMPTGCANR